MAQRRNLELELALAAAPDDRVARQVYADWLAEQGDPWSELISRQLGSMRELPRELELIQAELAASLPTWAELLAKKELELHWRWGMVDRVQLHRHRQGAWVPPLKLEPMLEELFEARAFAAMTGLEVDFRGWERSQQQLLHWLQRTGRPRSLRQLTFGPALDLRCTHDSLRDVFPHLTPAVPLHRIRRGPCLELVSLGTVSCETMSVGELYPLHMHRQTTLGRDNERADIVVSHQAINRRNFAIELAGNAGLFSHLGGTNPIALNGSWGHDWRRARLDEGDEISPVEGFVLRFRVVR